MGDDDDGVLAFELGDELLDLEGGERVECGAGLVHQQDLGLVGDGAGDAKPLLLSAGETKCGIVQAILHFIPQRGGFEGALDGFVQFGTIRAAGHPQAEDHVFVDRLGERVVFLEDHADALAQRDHLHRGIVEADAVEPDVALVADAIDQVVHAVHVAQQRGLAAAGWADQCGDAVLRDRHVDVENRLLLSVVETEVLHADEVGTGFWKGGGHFNDCSETTDGEAFLEAVADEDCGEVQGHHHDDEQ